MPDYVDTFATDLTVHITPIIDSTVSYDPSKYYNYIATIPEHNVFTVYGPPGRFTWIVYGKRNSINAEPLKSSVSVKGEGPYRWIS